MTKDNNKDAARFLWLRRPGFKKLSDINLVVIRSRPGVDKAGLKAVFGSSWCSLLTRCYRIALLITLIGLLCGEVFSCPWESSLLSCRQFSRATNMRAKHIRALLKSLKTMLSHKNCLWFLPCYEKCRIRKKRNYSEFECKFLYNPSY